MRFIRYMALVSILALGISSCGKEEEKKELPEGMREVEVLEKMDASSYSYFRVEEDGKEFWIAVNKSPAVPGDKLYFTGGMEMKNYFSQTLNKNFESVLFVDKAETALPGMGTELKHPEVKADQVVTQKVDPVQGSKTIAEIYTSKMSLAGKTIKARGKVVKINSGIMGKNWIHIQDGTQTGGKYDLLITSLEEAKLGEVILVEGKAAADKDFGSGYSYEVLIEDAKILR